MVGAFLRRRAVIAVLALFCVGFLSTCDFLTSDIFPSWFSYVEARVDLRSILKAEGLGEEADVVTVEYAPYDDGSADYSAVLVFAAGNLSKRLIVLDAENLARRAALYHANLNASIGAGAANFRCGDALVSPLTLTFEIDPTAWDKPDTRMFRDAVGGSNYVVRPNSSSQAVFEKYDYTWGPGPAGTRSYDSLNRFYNLGDAEYVNGWSVLATLQESPYGFATSYSSDTAFYLDGGVVFDDPVALQTGPFRADEGWAWLTSGGPVAFTRGDHDTNRLVRYRWGTGDFTNEIQAEAVDSIPFDDTDELRVLSFDASGTWWFAYDRRTGYLYKLRTWWK